MNRIVLALISILFLGLTSNAQDQKPTITLSPDGEPKMHLVITEHDFGDIQQGVKPEYVFTFVNEGSAALVINDVKTPCSCTAPSWSKEKVDPGKSGEIRIQYNSTGRVGTFVKTVTINFNSDQSPTFITIKGNVVVPK